MEVNAAAVVSAVSALARIVTMLLGCWLVWRAIAASQSIQLWLTADASTASCFPYNVGRRIQLRLGTLGFTTVLEEIRD